MVFVLADSSGKQTLKPVRIRVGITDGTTTELLSSTDDAIKEGTMVVIGIEEQANATKQTTNPFQPASPFGGGRQGGGGGGRGQGGGQGGGARGGGGR